MRGLHRRVRWSGRHWRSSRVLPSVGLLQAIPVRRPQDGDRNSITEELGIASDEASCPVVQVGGSGATEIAPASHADRERADGVDDEIPHCVGEARRVAEHGLLHGQPENLVHRELEYLPKGADRLGEARSEEHTSELQSLMRISYAVFCLKKKKKKQ